MKIKYTIIGGKDREYSNKSFDTLEDAITFITLKINPKFEFSENEGCQFINQNYLLYQDNLELLYGLKLRHLRNDDVFRININNLDFLLCKNNKRFVIFKINNLRLKRIRILKDGRIYYKNQEFRLSRFLRICDYIYGTNFRRKNEK